MRRHVEDRRGGLNVALASTSYPQGSPCDIASRREGTSGIRVAHFWISSTVDAGRANRRRRIVARRLLPPVRIMLAGKEPEAVLWRAGMIDTNSAAIVAIDAASAPYLGQWHRLVSTTNWEKGRIVQEWRTALSQADAPSSEYADEAWSRRVGNVTGQHVGRLRRVFERFGPVAAEFPGLYWSHFQTALDWDDAEMWLEGAVQSRWSVAEMRRQRWELREAAEGRTVDETELASESPEEDFAPLPDSAANSTSRITPATSSTATDRDADDNDKGRHAGLGDRAIDDDANRAEDSRPDDRGSAVRPAPFAHLVELPDDLAEAFESFKLAIVRHRLAGWHEAARDDVLAALDALRELALAPVD
jgi:hypothetical protein